MHPYLLHLPSDCELDLKEITLGDGDAPVLEALLANSHEISLFNAKMSSACRSAFIDALVTTNAKSLEIPGYRFSIEEAQRIGTALAQRSADSPHLEIDVGLFMIDHRDAFKKGFIGPDCTWTRESDPLSFNEQRDLRVNFRRQELKKEGFKGDVVLIYSTDHQAYFLCKQ